MSVIGRAGDTMPVTHIPYCHDCGQIHGSMLEVFACDVRVGRSTPGLTDEERESLLSAGVSQ